MANPTTSHHALAKAAFSKSGASGLYDRARPSYPTQAIQRIISHLPKLDTHVIEVGTGTGLFTRSFIPHASTGQISKWTAIEPAEGMRESFMSSIASFDKGEIKIECSDGTFDRMGSVESGSGQVVIAAQAWHWTGTDPVFQERCVGEVERVLELGGHFVLIWNLKDREVADWVGAIRDTYEVYESGTPQYRLGKWKTLFQTETFKKCFKLLPPDEIPEDREVKNVDDSIDRSHPTMTVRSELPMTLDQLQARILSKSYITALEPDLQEKVKDEIRSIWETRIVGNPEVEWIDATTVKFPYVTHVYIMQKIKSAS